MTEADYRVKSKKRPYRTNKFGHTHDCWSVDYRRGENDWPTKFDADYSKKEAKKKIREFASAGEKIRIEDKDGNVLRVEEVSE